MNKKRKILTAGGTGGVQRDHCAALHQLEWQRRACIVTSLDGGKAYLPGHAPEIEDVRLPAVRAGRVLRRAVRYPRRQQTKRNNESFLIAG